jgi:hypothetical protein
MNQWNDERIESALRRHMAQELDQHVGSAGRRFAAHANRKFVETGLPVMRIVRDAQPDKPRRAEAKLWFGPMWTVGVTGAAIAATLAVVLFRHTTAQPPTPGGRSSPGGGNRPVATDVQPVSRDVSWQTIDQGLVRLENGNAARKLLQKRTDTLKLYDKKHKRQIEYTVPREETVYVGYSRH